MFARTLIGLSMAAAALSGAGATSAAPAPPGPIPPTSFVCTGALAAQGHKIAADNSLRIASDPKACFSQMSIYGSGPKELIAVAPSGTCTGGKVLEVYGKSNAGSWYSFFEHPVCGAGVSIGPKSQWGDWMLTIGGVRYGSRGAYYVPSN